jgi:hypothetical protein
MITAPPPWEDAAAISQIDFTGYFVYPESAAFSRYHELYCEAARRKGGAVLSWAAIAAGRCSTRPFIFLSQTLGNRPRGLCVQTK